MAVDPAPQIVPDLVARFERTRARTEALAAPLSAEDQTVQSMPDVSPTKWHRGHTAWFFETFLLEPRLAGYEPYDPAFAFIFNSYYETVGARHARDERGLISRPGVAEVARYRRHVDEAMERLLALPELARDEDLLSLAELGIHHEQQHQELLLMDIKHVLSRNPAFPAYGEIRRRDSGEAQLLAARKPEWIEHPGGLVEIGHAGPGFAFDHESPRHQVFLSPFAVADRAVSCGDWVEFIEDGGYRRAELWLSEGWREIGRTQVCAPLYWVPAAEGEVGSGWRIFTLGGLRRLVEHEPVCHVSYYEADAFARWAGCRLPTEAEWETVAASADDKTAGNLFDPSVLHPVGPSSGTGMFGDVWEWTSSSYGPYPGFSPAAGSVGEYNGKFMVNQYVLRGGSFATPGDHVRDSYRNFFPAAAQWPFSGLRLARDL